MSQRETMLAAQALWDEVDRDNTRADLRSHIMGAQLAIRETLRVEAIPEDQQPPLRKLHD